MIVSASCTLAAPAKAGELLLRFRHLRLPWRPAGAGRLLALTPLMLLLNGCVATTAGAVTSTTIAIATAGVMAPIKVGGAVINTVSNDEEEDSD